MNDTSLKSEVFNLDCLEGMRTRPPASVSYVITSPPYNLGNTTGGGMKQYKSHYSENGGMKQRGGQGKWKGAALAHGYDSFNDNMPYADYMRWQREVLSECWRLIDDSGAIFYNHKQRILNGVCITPLEYLPAEVSVRQIITWARSGGINFNIRFYMPTDEWIVVLAKPGFQLKSKGASGLGSVWNFSQETNNPHPAPFPYRLPANILESVARINKPVLDPFSGSGTTRLAAHDFGYDFVGYEIDDGYCRMSDERYERHTAKFVPGEGLRAQAGLF